MNFAAELSQITAAVDAPGWGWLQNVCFSNAPMSMKRRQVQFYWKLNYFEFDYSLCWSSVDAVWWKTNQQQQHFWVNHDIRMCHKVLFLCGLSVKTFAMNIWDAINLIYCTCTNFLHMYIAKTCTIMCHLQDQCKNNTSARPCAV